MPEHSARLCTIPETMVDKNKKTWSNKLLKALGAYRTNFRTETPATTYSLIFNEEVVLPLEVRLPLVRVVVHKEMLPRKEPICV